MGGYYGYTREERAQLYLAASLHDIGKLATPAAILEKSGRTGPEFPAFGLHDIYQTVSEERPCHPGRNHGDAIQILYGMANKGWIDAGIAAGMDRALAPFDGGDVPAPVYTPG
ncbi:MAG: hypothetical protein LBD31_03715 [Treponema sp.]|jgi:HD-GYP domain-containing protein (c-di-GMP phosphodiesterase class II)|nr:hypothetical protein [Treponema sp.]